MAKKSIEKRPIADLQTAQNRMFSFVAEAIERFEIEDRVSGLLEDPDKLKILYNQVRQQVFDLLNIPTDKRNLWHIGIADSGKRTIEILVNYLCPAQPGKNALVDTENYVGFNKFSAAKALEKQKGMTFETPFKIDLGHALTVNAEKEFDKLEPLFQADRFSTLWLSWNSTSTGVREKIEQIVHCRNAAKSKTIIVADAASYRLFSKGWEEITSEDLPDVFFFSLRKQGLPYDGPNDEFHQAQNSGSLIIFNNHALTWAQAINAAPLYDSPTLAQYADSQITKGEQRANHVRHLLKIDCALSRFLGENKAQLAVLDGARKTAQLKIKQALAPDNNGSSTQFSLFSDPDAQSDSAYILKVPENTTAKKVISGLKEKGVLISASMHPKMDGQKIVRFAFYPGNSIDEVDILIKHIEKMA